MVTTETKISSCAISDIGLVRQNNEDVWGELSELRLYVLADGMGGHQSGEVAARAAVETACQLLQRPLKSKKRSLDDSAKLLTRVMKEVNDHVFELGETKQELRGMGTTLCVLFIHDEGAVYGHVGDSRIYRFREGQITLLTQDHRISNEYYKNIITRAIGTEPYVEPSVDIDLYQPGDKYILCSDGMSDLISIPEMERIFKDSSNLSESTLNLVSLSKIKGGHDNITVVVVDIEK